MDIVSANLFITQIEEKISRLSEALAKSEWKSSITGKKEDYDEYTENGINLRKLLNDKESYEKLKGLKKESFDDLLNRQIELYFNLFLSYQGDFSLVDKITRRISEAEMKFNTFRAKIDEKVYTENEIKDILKNETGNAKLEIAWKAIKEQGKIVEKDIIEIVELRNRLARELGYENFHKFSLAAGEQEEEELDKLFAELESMTKGPFTKIKEELDMKLQKRYKISKEELRPWHYGDPFFQEGPSLFEVDFDKFYSDDILEKVTKYYESFGLGDEVKKLIKNSDLFEKPGKNQHAFCIDIDRKGDVRTLQNLKNNSYWMGTALHEFGHGVYSMNHDRNLPWILRDAAHLFTTEAIAMLLERKTKNVFFIKKYCRYEGDLDSIKKIGNKKLKFRQLVFSRWVQVMYNFEKELYKNPRQNLNKLWWDLVKKFQLVDYSRDAPDWASKYHFLAAPVYYHNYLLGELLASQLHDYITKNFTGDKDSDYSGHIEVGKFFKEKIFAPGARYKWNEMIERATGEKLTAKYYVKEFCK